MRAHAKPNFQYNVNLNQELAHLVNHLQQPNRAIPQKTNQNLLIGTWNLTNFGLQHRQDVHLKLMADILRRFDLIAVQEIADDLEDFHKLVGYLGSTWDYFYTDVAGNQERLAYVYDQSRVWMTGLAAELAMRGYERTRIVIEDIETEDFTGFNRNPYILGFAAGGFEFYLANVHLYWSNVGIRRLETKALAKWADSRVGKSHPPNNDIILIGDFNMPHVGPGDSIYDEVVQYGLTLPAHTTNVIGTNLAGDKNYDQLAFFPSRTTEDFTNRMGVFDFDNALFPNLYQSNQTDFFQYIRYYIADHRPMWAEFRR